MPLDGELGSDRTSHAVVKRELRMSKAKGVHVDIRQDQAFLANHLDTEASEVVLIGEGAWSRCFGFRRNDEELVIRFGNHFEDFRKDRLAYACTTAELPIPKVLYMACHCSFGRVCSRSNAHDRFVFYFGSWRLGN